MRRTAGAGAHRTAGAVAAVAFLTAGLAGCGGGHSSASGYCSDVQATKDTLTGLTENRITQSQFDTLLSSLHTIRDEAPTSVRADWSAFSSAADEFNTAIHAAGMTLTDVRDMQNDPHMAEGPKMDAVMGAARSLNSLAVQRAELAIEREVRQDCSFSLG